MRLLYPFPFHSDAAALTAGKTYVGGDLRTVAGNLTVLSGELHNIAQVVGLRDNYCRATVGLLV